MTEDDASSVVFEGGVVQEPRVCLALDELIPVTEVRQACEAPEPAKIVQILFRGEHGPWSLETGGRAVSCGVVWWEDAGRRGEGGRGLDGYFATVGGKILDSRARVGSLGLGHMAEVVFHRRLLGGQRWLPSEDWRMDVL